jgi:hypothetical protein
MSAKKIIFNQYSEEELLSPQKEPLEYIDYTDYFVLDNNDNLEVFQNKYGAVSFYYEYSKPFFHPPQEFNKEEAISNISKELEKFSKNFEHNELYGRVLLKKFVSRSNKHTAARAIYEQKQKAHNKLASVIYHINTERSDYGTPSISSILPNWICIDGYWDTFVSPASKVLQAFAENWIDCLNEELYEENRGRKNMEIESDPEFTCYAKVIDGKIEYLHEMIDFLQGIRESTDIHKEVFINRFLKALQILWDVIE